VTIKVAHLTTVDMSVRHLLLNQLLTLKDAGFDVAAISAAGPDLGPVEAAGIRHLPVSFTRRMSPLSDLKAFSQLLRIFRRERFTIIHTHQAKAALLGQAAARAAGVPLVVNTLHGFYFHDRTPDIKRAAWIGLERMQALCSDLILSQNPEDIETAVRTGICSRDRLEYLGNGIDLTRFDRAAISSADRGRTRADLGIPEGVPVVGFVGRLVKEKGILDLFAAFKRTLATSPDARLLVVGPEDLEKTDAVTFRTAADYGIETRTVFVGYRHDMPALYAAMDVAVLPSHREGFPRSPMEASAMGVPCVATNIRGCRQVVRQEENGLLVPVSDERALGDAIARILGDPDLAARMSDTATRMAQQEFDERTVFARVIAAYGRLLRAKGVSADTGHRAESAFRA
jgi:glycosyltransferase involved in cell wall biosynthesis